MEVKLVCWSALEVLFQIFFLKKSSVKRFSRYSESGVNIARLRISERTWEVISRHVSNYTRVRFVLHISPRDPYNGARATQEGGWVR